MALLILLKKIQKKFAINERGNSLIPILVVGGIINTALIVGYNQFQGQQYQVLRSNQMFQYEIALQSVVDYTIYGIKRRWCFNPDMLRVDNPSDCNLLHDGNTERLVLSSDTIRSIEARDPLLLPRPARVQLDKIVREVNISSMASGHPLYQIVQNLKGSFADDTGTVQRIFGDVVRIEISHYKDKKFLPRGRETYLKIMASIPVLGGFGFVSGTSVAAEAIIAMLPRELNTFALVLPHNLRLDKTHTSILGTGESAFNLFVNKLAANVLAPPAASSPGMVFDSPVFINGDLHLPPQDNAFSPYGAGADDHYNAVTFNDAVVLGNGNVLRDGAAAKPASAGATGDTFNDQMKNFGGLRKGVNIDGERDLGLDVLAGLRVGGTVDTSLMTRCIARNNVLSSLRETNQSAAIVREMNLPELIGGTDRKFRFKLALSDDNIFQSIPPPGGIRDKQEGSTPGIHYPDPDGSGPLESPSIEKSGIGTSNVISEFQILFNNFGGDKGHTFRMNIGGVASFIPDLDQNLCSNPNANTLDRLSYASGSGCVGVGEKGGTLKYRAADGSEQAITTCRVAAITPKCGGRDLGDGNDISCPSGQSGKVLEVCQFNPTTSTYQMTPVANSCRPSADSLRKEFSVQQSIRSCAAGERGATGSYCNTDGTVKEETYCRVETANPKCDIASLPADQDPWLGEIRNRACAADEAGRAVDQCRFDTLTSTYKMVQVASSCRKKPEIKLELKPYLVSGNPQDNQFILETTFKNESSFYFGVNQIVPRIQFTIYELGTKASDGSNRRSSAPSKLTALDNNSDGIFDFINEGRIPFIHNASGISEGFYQVSEFRVGHHVNRFAYPTVQGPPDESFDYYSLAASCNSGAGVGGASFGLADWDVNYSAVTAASWSFAEPQASLVLSSSNSPAPPPLPGVPDLRFLVRSIVDDCTIQSSATLVTGFFLCRNLTIESRTSPLEIIGTMIIGQRLDVHPDAIKAGITWRSIFHPEAVKRLRNPSIAILKPVSPYTCESTSTPLWNPFADATKRESDRTCSPLNLRERANPFSWTTVNPDCGLQPGHANTTCKGRAMRYSVHEVHRAVKCQKWDPILNIYKECASSP